jgi:hypothetical protein
MKISLREFQRHFHRYKSQECEVFGVKGDPVGNWVPVVVTVALEEEIEEEEEENDSQSALEDTEKVKRFSELKASFGVPLAPRVTLSDKPVGSERGMTATLTEEAPRCLKCGGIAVGKAQTANESGEVDDYYVCGRCVKFYKLRLNGHI